MNANLSRAIARLMGYVGADIRLRQEIATKASTGQINKLDDLPTAALAILNDHRDEILKDLPQAV
jgi:hypothetical protein